jgi:hypothetical protein
VSYPPGRLRRARWYRRLVRVVPLSRPCYDKTHRCPGWAGGGVRSARVVRCRNGRLRRRGSMDAIYLGRGWAWRFNRCDTCRLLVLPYVVRYVDLRWWTYRTRSRWRYR